MSGVRTDAYEKSMSEVSREGQRNITQSKQQYNRDLEDIRVKNEREKAKLAKDYELQLTSEKNRHEQDLIELRKKYDTVKTVETERLSRELQDMSAAHEEKVAELKKSQTQEIEKYQETQKNFIDGMKERMQSERMKNNA